MSGKEQLAQVLNEWTAVLMRRSMQDMRDLMQETGLSLPQLSTAVRLNYGKARSVSDIAAGLGVTNAAASKMIDRLVDLGLVLRRENPRDRRGKLISLSDEGKVLVRRAVAARQQWLENLTAQLDEEAQELIVTSLVHLTQAARALETNARQRQT